ncbi:MAG: purine-nucleoside phosphorylase [Myxococcales bacterium]|nr:purine-nucleoside phosphorylase [Myxococcales bacterium]
MASSTPGDRSGGQGSSVGELLKRIEEACEYVRERARDHGRHEPRVLPPTVGLVLGSGLGPFAERLGDALRIDFQDIPGMPAPRVSGHAGALWLGFVGEVPVACLQGRVHLYEGHELERVVFGVRVLARLGCHAVLLTNAAGGLRPTSEPGTLMLVTDHLNLTGRSPLTGPNDDALGPRFPDLTRAYDPGLRALAREAAAEVRVRLTEGVYAGMNGPQYETPAEITMLRMFGADAVGMSTVLEVIALRHMGVRTAAVSCITNFAAGTTPFVLDHAEVERTAIQARESFASLLSAWITRIGAAARAAAADEARR